MPVRERLSVSETGKRALLWAVSGAVILFVFAALYSEGKRQEPVTATAFTLNTVVKITLYDSQEEQILQQALELCEDYEKIFSRTLPESELYRLNHGMLPQEDGWTLLSEPLADLISEGIRYSRLSEGAFDISIAPVSSLWDFTSGEKKIPEKEKIEQAVTLVDYKDIFLEGNRIRFAKEGMQLELGAIAKGYIADRIKEFLVSEGIRSAVIDLGGNVLCVGDKPDRSPFRIGVQKPFATRNQTVGTVEISGQSVVSSGIYERYFEQDGKLYHHILNPADGYPYDHRLVSVTIVSEKSVDGDGLSTSCFALGLEKGLALINSLPETEAVFITEDGALHFSEGFEEKLGFQYL